MRGLSEKTAEPIGFAGELLDVSHPMTVRQLHYAFFSAAKIDYDNTQAGYKRLSRATTYARRLHRDRELAGCPTHLMPKLFGRTDYRRTARSRKGRCLEKRRRIYGSG
jgi:hypothetical protein